LTEVWNTAQCGSDQDQPTTSKLAIKGGKLHRVKIGKLHHVKSDQRKNRLEFRQRHHKHFEAMTIAFFS